MNPLSILTVSFLFTGQVFNLWAEETGSASGSNPAKRVYQITKIEGESPRIDGVVNEACWQQGTWDGDFLEQNPVEGAVPSEQTEVKLLYDDEAIYVAIRAYVDDVENRDRQIGRRDSWAGDMVGFALDSYFDKQTAYEFNVSGGGSKVDIMIHSRGSDRSWNAVWDVAVGEEENAWVAEYRVPFSQLRFPTGIDSRTWGLHVWRWHRVLNMESQWNLIPRDNSGFVYEFGELKGLQHLQPKRQIEILPYVSGSLVDAPREDGNPFLDGKEYAFEAGVDAKIGITSNFIVDLTINPDFGQVEADPAQLNLGTVESFFQEQRPFFLEGKSLFTFDVEGDQVFYSRRIGRAPRHEPDSDGYVEVPNGTRILGAAKMTGKTRNGLSVGALYAMAAEEQATVFEDGNYRNEVSEPQTQYLVSRVQQEFDEGGTTIGGIVTGVFRELEANDPTLLVDRAVSAGFDLKHRWLERTHYANLTLIGSHVAGDEAAIAELQQNNLHNFDRVDADYVEFDPTRESLSGWGGTIEVGKDNGGHWRYFSELDWRSPELELNDIGYIRTVDRINWQNVVRYVQQDPGVRFKRYVIRLDQQSKYLYDGSKSKDSVDLRFDFTTNHNWGIRPRIGYDSDVVSVSGLRGGPAMKYPGSWNAQFNLSSDGSKDFMWWIGTYFDRSFEGRGRYAGIWPGFRLKRGSRLSFSFNMGYNKSESELSWLDSVEDDHGDTGYFLSGLDRETFQSTVRLDYNFTPEISLTYFGNFYVSSGIYSDFKQVTDPMANDMEDRYYLFGPDEWFRDDSGLTLSREDLIYRMDEPDFNYRSFKSNLVFRWEFKPGSTLFLVWSQNRENSDLDRFSTVANDFDKLIEEPAHNTIMVKASYWFSI